jgi:hypothetical protein
VWINANTRASKADPPTPEQSQDTLRKDQAAYMEFADIMIRAVHGKSRYGDTAGTTTFNSFISKSQEAFTLLLYENGYKNWVWSARNDPGSSSDGSIDGCGGSTTDSNCSAYGYTTRSKEDMPGRNGGWSTEGMLKYNELYRKVATDREIDDGIFEKAYMAHRVGKFRTDRKRKRGQSSNPVPILDDLGDLGVLNQDASVEVAVTEI